MKIRVESPYFTEKGFPGPAIAQLTEQLVRDTEDGSARRYAHSTVFRVAHLRMNFL